MGSSILTFFIATSVICDLASGQNENRQGWNLPARSSLILPHRKSQPYDNLVRAIRRDYVVRYAQQERPCQENNTVMAVRTAPVIARDLALVYGGRQKPAKNGGGCGGKGGGSQKISQNLYGGIGNSKTFEYNKPEKPLSSFCEDSHELCCFWASLGHCDSNLYWMRPNCQKACGTCGCTSENAESCIVHLGSCGPMSNIVPTQPPMLPPPVFTTQQFIPPVNPVVPLTVPPIIPEIPKPTNPGSCEDAHDLCCFWASLGHCDSNMYWMRPNCQKTCGTCGCTPDDAPNCKVNLQACGIVETISPPAPEVQPTSAPQIAVTTGSSMSTGCSDSNEYCCFWASLGHCDSNPYWMRPNCQKACGTCGCTFENAMECRVKLGACGEPPLIDAGSTDKRPPMEEKVTEKVTAPPKTEVTEVSPPGSCSDSHELCCFWASVGHCDSNSSWMRPNCQNACGTCGCTVDNADSCVVKLGSCGPQTGGGDYGGQGSKVQPTEQPKIEVEASPTPPPPPPPTVTQSSTVGEPVTQATPSTEKEEACSDKNELCCFWASMGHCDSNMFWMRPNCQKSCGTCGCTDDTPADTCPVTPTECTKAAATAAPRLSTFVTPETFTVAPLITNPPPGPCSDSHELCCFWASEGHCDTNPFWMRPNCQISCGTCGCTAMNALSCPVHVPDTCIVNTNPPEKATLPTVNTAGVPGPPAFMEVTVPPPVTEAQLPEQPAPVTIAMPPPLPPSSTPIQPPPPQPSSSEAPLLTAVFTMPPTSFANVPIPAAPGIQSNPYGSMNGIGSSQGNQAAVPGDGYSSFQAYQSIQSVRNVNYQSNVDMPSHTTRVKAGAFIGDD